MVARWLVVALVALVALAACNRLFGIAEIPFAGDAKIFEDAPPDAAPRAILEIGDPALDFGQVTRGDSSFAAIVEVTNVGDASTGVLTAMGSGDQREYDVELGTCNTSLAPGAGCKLTITFVPQDIGTFMDTVVIGDGVAMTTIVLNGTGLTPGALDIMSPVGFGSAAVASTNNKQSILVTNEGGAAVTITSMAVTGSSFFMESSGSCSMSIPIASNGTCTIDVDFEPVSGGSQLGSLVVMTAGSSNPSLSSLGGTGTATVTVTLNGDATGKVKSPSNEIMCAPTCSATFDTSTVPLSAVVNPDIAIGWTPNCITQSPTACAVTVDQAMLAVTFTFTAFPVLTVGLTGSPGEVTGGGIDCESPTGGPTCSMAFQPNTEVMLTATPLAGSVFNEWTGACGPSSSPACQLTMTSDLSTTADFETGHVLDVTPENGNAPDPGDTLVIGAIPCSTGSGCQIVYPAVVPTSVTITATSDSCSMFEGFSGPCGSGDPPNECTVDPMKMQITTVLFKFVQTQGGSGTQCVTGP